jgi:ABC-type amino acid transport system permease subunit
VIKVLQIVHEDGRVPNQAASALNLCFIMVLMLKVLGITNELSRALQTKGLNIVNALEVSSYSNVPLLKILLSLFSYSHLLLI